MDAVPFLPSLLPGQEGLTEGVHDMKQLLLNPLGGSGRASEMRPSILRVLVMCY